MKGWIVSLLLALSLSASAQIESATETLDFGVIHESDGPKTIRAYIRNISEKPAAILKVTPTCGCTAASFYTEKIQPGDSAWIDLTYNPNRRPGRIEKAVKVYPVDGEMIRIPITGVVFSTPETIQAMFPSDGGLLHLSETILMPARGLSTGDKSLYLDAYNSNEFPVFTRLIATDDAVVAKEFDAIVPPGEKGLFGIYLYSEKETRNGPLEYDLHLFSAKSQEELDEMISSPDSSSTLIKVITDK